MDKKLDQIKHRYAMYPPPSILFVTARSDRASRLKQRLEDNGCDVQRIGACLNSLAAACRESFDLMVIDLEHVALSGIKICNELRTNPELTGIPVVLLAPHNKAKEAICELKIGSPVYSLPKDDYSEILLFQIIEQVHYMTSRYL